MKNLNDYLDGFNAADKRSALYYLTRYIKQSHLTHNKQEKDFFEDGKDNKAEEKIKLLTFELIAFI